MINKTPKSLINTDFSGLILYAMLLLWTYFGLIYFPHHGKMWDNQK